jgi:hypothetical protein
MLLDLGLRSRTIVQTGRLQADSAEALHALLDAVHAACNLQAATLVDNHGRSYPRVVLERIETVTPLRRGRGFYCDYQAEYRQLP